MPIPFFQLTHPLVYLMYNRRIEMLVFLTVLVAGDLSSGLFLVWTMAGYPSSSSRLCLVMELPGVLVYVL